MQAHTKDTRYGVHFVRPDGSGMHRWTADVPGTHEHPDWSPDGGQIVLNSVRADGGEDVWIGSVDGTQADKVVACTAPCIWADEPSWTPDGTGIIFQRLAARAGGGLTSTLELLEVDTGNVRVVLTMPELQVVLAPRFATAVDPDGGAIGIVDLDAPEPSDEYLTGFDSFANNPDWSPVGDVITFSQPTGPGKPASDPWTIAPDGTGSSLLTDVGIAEAHRTGKAWTAHRPPRTVGGHRRRPAHGPNRRPPAQATREPPGSGAWTVTDPRPRASSASRSSAGVPASAGNVP